MGKVVFDYLPGGPREEAWSFQVSAFGESTISPHQAYPPTGHPSDHAFSWNEGRILSSLQVVFISKGKGSFETKISGWHPVNPGHCFLILPGVWHRYRPDPAIGWTEHWFELSGRLLEEWLRQGLLETASPIILARNTAELAAEFRTFGKIALRKDAGYRPVLAAKALSILTSLLAEVPDSAENSYSWDLEKAHRLLRQHLSEKLSMHDIARRLSVSYPTFLRQFRSETGMSPKQYAEQMRLAHAQQLLSSTSLGLKEIAARLHYSSAFHLSRQFKLKFGTPPSVWRKERIFPKASP